MGYANIGIDVTKSYLGTDEVGIPFGVGNRFVDAKNTKEFVFVKATSAIAASDVVTFDQTASTTVAPLGTANDARGSRVGVAPVAIASGSYGWVQIYGAVTAMNVLASCAANVRINTTGTAGSLDDDGTAGSMQVQGIYLTTARGGTNGTAPGILEYPFVDVTL
jgi:hypothetical protein